MTYSSVKNASMMRVPSGLTPSSGINIRSSRLKQQERNKVRCASIGIGSHVRGSGNVYATL